MRVAIYARVSTADKEQNPETQLIPLREFCVAQGWTVAQAPHPVPRSSLQFAYTSLQFAYKNGGIG